MNRWYGFRIRPLARFFFACVLGIISYQTLMMAAVVQHPGPAVFLMLCSALFAIAALVVTNGLGRILRAYLDTWR